MYLEIPDGHGPWCGCAVCQACARSLAPQAQYEIATALYKAELEKIQQRPSSVERDLREANAIMREANAELRAQLADIERMYLGYEVTRYAPPSQMRTFERTVEYRTLEPREGHLAVWLALAGMIIMLALVSQVLWIFH